jgi:hypothetical protein
MFLVSGIVSSLGSHRADAAVVGDARSAKSTSSGKMVWHSCEGNPANIDDAVTKYLVTTTAPPMGTICQPNRAPFDPDFGKPLFREQPVD